MRLERTGPLGGSSFYFIPFQLAFKDYPGAKGSRFSDEAYRIKLFDEAKAGVGKLQPPACVGATTRMALRCPRCNSTGDHRHADNNAGCFQADGLSHRAAQPEHDAEKWKPVFPRDKRETRLRGDHAL
jgi:hypothetical protein